MPNKQTLFISFCLILALFYISIHSFCMHCDIAYYIECAHLILDGKLPYAEIVDINLPLIMYFHVVPEFIARLFHLNEAITFYGFVMIVIFYSMWAAGGLLYRLKGVNATDVKLFLFGYGLISFQLFFANDFGEREQLFILLYLPFVILRVLNYENYRTAWYTSLYVGFLAGIGILLKPHFLIVAIAPEIYWFVRFRNIRKLFAGEVLAVLLCAVIYAIHFFLVPEAMRHALFEVWIPLFTKNYYNVRKPVLYYLYFRPITLFALLMVIAGIVSMLASSQRWVKSVIAPLILMAIGAIAIMLFQGKSWTYQTIPVIYSAVAIMMVIVLSAWDRCVVSMRAESLAIKPLVTVLKRPEIILLIAAIIFYLCHFFVYRYMKHDLIGTLKDVGLSPVAVVFGGLAFGVSIISLPYLEPDKSCNTVIRFLLPYFVATGLFAGLVVINPVAANERLFKSDPLIRLINYHTIKKDPIFIYGNQYPLLEQLNRRSGTRYLAPTFFLGLAVQNSRCTTYEDLPPMAKLFFQQLEQDITTNRLKLLVVDKKYDKYCNNLSMTGFIQANLHEYAPIEAPSGYNAFMRAK